MPNRYELQKGVRIDYDAFGKRLKTIRDTTNLDQKSFYLEYLRGYDPDPCKPQTAQSRVSHYEYGYVMPCGDLLLRYAEIAGLTIDELLTNQAAGGSYGNALKTLANLYARGIIDISEDGSSISVPDGALRFLLSQLNYQKKHNLSDIFTNWLSKTIKRFNKYLLAVNPASVHALNNLLDTFNAQSHNEELKVINAVLNINNEALGAPSIDDAINEED